MICWIPPISLQKKKKGKKKKQQTTRQVGHRGAGVETIEGFAVLLELANACRKREREKILSSLSKKGARPRLLEREKKKKGTSGGVLRHFMAKEGGKRDAGARCWARFFPPRKKEEGVKLFIAEGRKKANLTGYPGRNRRRGEGKKGEKKEGDAEMFNPLSKKKKKGKRRGPPQVGH